MSKRPLPNSSDARQRQPEAKTSRRTFFNRVWIFFATCTFLELGWLSFSIFKSQKTTNSAKAHDAFTLAGKADSFARGTVTAIPLGQFYLSRLEDGSFCALSKTCTHLGCSLTWDENEKKFICPCHGSSFDRTGKVLVPPATRGLDSYPLRLEDGLLLVNTAKPEKRLAADKPIFLKV